MTVKEYGWVGSDHLVSLGFILNACEDQRLTEFSKLIAEEANASTITKKEKLQITKPADGPFIQVYHPGRIVIAAISLALMAICIASCCYYAIKRRGLCKKKTGNTENEAIPPHGTVQIAQTESSIDIEN